MKKLSEHKTQFIDDNKLRIMRFKESVASLWKTDKASHEATGLRRTCSESILFRNDWLQRLKHFNLAHRNIEETGNKTNETLRRTIKVEHSVSPRQKNRVELKPVKPCLRTTEQLSGQSKESTPCQICRRVTFSTYALILHAAGQNSVTELKDLLDRKPLHINKPSSSGETALHKAAAKGSLDCVKLLVQRGANVNKVDKEGRTPLLIAWEKGHFDCHRYMLESLKICDNDSPC